MFNPQPDESPNVHSTFSPSGSSRWLLCPGSIKMEKMLKQESGTSSYAAEGTAVHELSAHCLLFDKNPHDLEGETFYDIEITKEMTNGAETYVDYVRMLDSATSHNSNVERLIDLSFLHPNTFGTADAVCYDEEEKMVDVVDLKYGKGVVVEVKENTQLMIYAIGVVKQLLDNGHDVKRIKLHIVQPRAPHTDGPIRTWELGIEDLRKFAKHVKAKITDACSNNPTINPGESQCRWCRAAPICKPLAKHNLSLAQAEFSEFMNNSPKELVSPNALTPEQISKILKHSKLFEEWLKAVAIYAKVELDQGRQIPGYKLVYGRSNRKWKSEDDVLKLLIELGYNEDDYYSKKFVSPNQAEQLLGKRKKELKELIYKPVGNVTLAPESDSRPPVDPSANAQADFEEWK